MYGRRRLAKVYKLAPREWPDRKKMETGPRIQAQWETDRAVYRYTEAVSDVGMVAMIGVYLFLI